MIVYAGDTEREWSRMVERLALHEQTDGFKHLLPLDGSLRKPLTLPAPCLSAVAGTSPSQDHMAHVGTLHSLHGR